MLIQTQVTFPKITTGQTFRWCENIKNLISCVQLDYSSEWIECKTLNKEMFHGTWNDILYDLFVTENGFVYYRKTNQQIAVQYTQEKYLQCRIGTYKNYTGYKVHRLVANAFVPNPENKPQVNHLDGNKENNHYKNLMWATNRENVIHAFETGLASRKLTRDAAKQLRSMYPEFTMEQLAERFSIPSSHVCRILQNKVYYDNTYTPPTGRHKGASNYLAKLTMDQAREIRKLYPSLSAIKLGKMYGVAHSQIRNIVRNISYREED